jgi:dUTP pyrophosphatase
LALKHGVTCLNSPGLIDSGYRDELKVLLINTDPENDYEVRRGDRIAQLVIQAVEQAEWDLVDDLGSSARGAGGFGHSGR